jgi:hypothetical protein
VGVVAGFRADVTIGNGDSGSGRVGYGTGDRDGAGDGESDGESDGAGE